MSDTDFRKLVRFNVWSTGSNVWNGGVGPLLRLRADYGGFVGMSTPFPDAASLERPDFRAARENEAFDRLLDDAQIAMDIGARANRVIHELTGA